MDCNYICAKWICYRHGVIGLLDIRFVSLSSSQIITSELLWAKQYLLIKDDGQVLDNTNANDELSTLLDDGIFMSKLSKSMLMYALYTYCTL